MEIDEKAYLKYLETKEKQNKYRQAYNKKNYKRFVVNLSYEKDALLIDYLDKKSNVTDYVRKLVWKDILNERSNKKDE